MGLRILIQYIISQHYDVTIYDVTINLLWYYCFLFNMLHSVEMLSLLRNVVSYYDSNR